jgi:CHAT domain-containing protein
LQELYVGFAWKRPEDLPTDEIKAVSHFAAFDILCNKARLLRTKYNRLQKRPSLEAALNTYLLAIRTAAYIKRNFDNDESKLFFNNNHNQTYFEALAVADGLLQLEAKNSYVNSYIEIIEGYKGNIILQNQRNIELKTSAAIPDSLRRREKEVKQLVALYSTKLSNSRKGSDVGILEKGLLELQVELSRIQKAYEADPAYALYKNLRPANQTDIGKVQSFLGNTAALLNYVVADSIVYALAIDKKGFVAHRFRTDSSFARHCRSFLTETYSHPEGRRYEGFAPGFQLHGQLVAPLAAVLGHATHWVVLPDGILNYLPFEAMTRSANRRDYLMLDHTISYHYSAALLLQENSHHTANSNNRHLFFAPFSLKDTAIGQSGLPPLPFSQSEQHNGAATLAKLGQSATKQQFLLHAPQYNVLHLATHASSGNDSSQAEWIQFYPQPGDSAINNRLYTPEIYTLDLNNTDLVILSACETAGGRSSSGEGLLSLSRAFLYAGSNGIVSTLWKTEDRVSAYLMKRFHAHLQKGDAAAALRQAKKDLLADPQMGPQYKTPNYWANFVYIGQVKPRPSGTYWLWLLLPLPLLLGIGWVWYKKKYHQDGSTPEFG